MGQIGTFLQKYYLRDGLDKLNGAIFRWSFEGPTYRESTLFEKYSGIEVMILQFNIFSRLAYNKNTPILLIKMAFWFVD